MYMVIQMLLNDGDKIADGVTTVYEISSKMFSINRSDDAFGNNHFGSGGHLRRLGGCIG